MSRLLALLCAAVCTGCVAVVLAPVSLAVVNPWFANSVGNATQVVSVVGTGGSTAKMDVYQRTAAGWQPLKTGITTHIGSAGMAPEAKSGYPATPMGGLQPGLRFWHRAESRWRVAVYPSRTQSLVEWRRQ